MAYKALYRTYRPQKFEEVIGQEVIVKTLQNALATNKTTHAYLFSGPRGTGKTTVARILAKALNCDSAPTNEPCGVCQSCREIMEGNSPDVIEIDAASNNGVDEIREIRDKVKFLPAGSKYKVYIIDEVHMLTTSAFNALLKTLEEPPKHVVFILATTEPHKVLPTILSRCQRYDFKSLTVQDIAGAIKNVADSENVQISTEAILGLAEGAEGGLRDALSFLDQAIALSDDSITAEDVNNVTGNLSGDKIIELAQYFEEKRISDALKTVNELLNLGKEVGKILSGLLQFYRDVLMYKNTKEGEYNRYIFTKPEFVALAKKIEERKVFYYIDVLSDAQSKIRTSTTPHIFLEVALIKLINVSQDDLDLIAKMKNLEERMMLIETTGSSVITPSAMSVEDIEKISVMDEKLSKVVVEMAKMDFPTLIKRIRALEENRPEGSSNVDERAIYEVQEDIQFLKVTYKALQNKVDNSRTENIEDMMERLTALEDLIKRNRPSINYNEIEKFVDRKLDEDLIKGIAKAKKELIKAVEASRAAELPKVEDFDLYELTRPFEDRISKIENNVYRLMSGQLATQQQAQPKKTKGKEKFNQTVLFSEEYVDVAEMKDEAQEAIEENYDETLDKDASINVQPVEAVEEITEASEVEQVTEEPTETLEVEQVTETSEAEQKAETLTEPELVAETQEKPEVTNAEEELVKAVNEETTILSAEVEMANDKEFEPVKPKVKELSPAEKALNRSLERLSRTSDLFASEREELMKEVKPIREEKPLVEKAPEPKPQEPVKTEPTIELDEFERFDICVVERILTSSLTAEARNEKARITNLWRNLVFAASSNDRLTAEAMAEGTIAAVGNGEFIIVFKEPTMCNQVMRRKFKRRAMKMLYDLLLTNYNYLALPEDVWTAKRTEFVNEYYLGRTNPKLSPINDPRLKVIIDEEEVDPKQQVSNRITKLFGDDPCIEIKK